jgi:aminoglycoside phosphotransferase (APT) family kinase protein
MNLHPERIDAMFARYGIAGPWESLPATGVANHIFATRDVVLRVATDYPDSVSDARTESVAAPIARAAGILTPKLITFDDMREIVDRPFSLWERIHGETLGLASLMVHQRADVWRSVGRELARLHLRVQEAPDPMGYLDDPRRNQEVEANLARLVEAKRLDINTTERVQSLADELRPLVTEPVETRFIHDDIHPMKIMCSSRGELLAIIDWGDAGWGDPALDFAAMPLDMVPWALAGYEVENPWIAWGSPRARIAWNRLLDAVDDLRDRAGRLDVDGLRRFAQSQPV